MPIPIKIDGHVLGQVVEVDGVEELLPYLSKYPSLRVVYDGNVETLSVELLEVLSRERGSEIPSLRICCTEEGKNLSTVEDICGWLLGSAADRSTLLLAAGGGICTDMAGFAACIYKRGIPFAFVPTTLLAMVDAAIGGKTGVNFHDLKNMLGVISQPVYTFECARALSTLPYRDFLSGAAELLKTFILDPISGKANYRDAVSLLVEVRGLGLAPEEPMGMRLHPFLPRLGVLIREAARVKASVVSEDPYESGRRKILNLGHTFAHGIEHEARLRGDDITHGEAVGMGIVLAARLSRSLGLCEGGEARRIEEDFARCGLPVRCPYPPGTLRGAMSVDKKAKGGKVPFILPCGIGDVRIVELGVDEAILGVE